MEHVLLDLRFALRMMLKNPLFAAVAILSLLGDRSKHSHLQSD